MENNNLRNRLIQYLLQQQGIQLDIEEEDEEYEDDEDYAMMDESELLQFSNETVEETQDMNHEVKQNLMKERIADEIIADSGCVPGRPDRNMQTMLQQREIGMGVFPFSAKSKAHIHQRILPQKSKTIDSHANQVFCGRFSSDGEYYMSACQDRKIRLYNTQNWKRIRQVTAKDVGWSIISTDYSPDKRWFIYSSWSDCIHICNLVGEHEVHDSLDLHPDADRFCLFSVQFSYDSNEILGGASDNSIYIYDLSRREVAYKIPAHSDDVNTACYLEPTNNNTILSGSDDTFIKVWDRRTFGSDCKPVGVLVGHLDGLTHLSSKGDGRYFVSNCKDQTIKLWDIRKMQSSTTKIKAISTGWDYRFGEQNFGTSTAPRVHPNDQSIMTYRGHKVYQTLIRCFFSPMETTGQKYIYTGSYDGSIVIYDVLTGAIVKKLTGHRATVRDVSWHPTENKIASASWDGTVRLWGQE